MNAEKRIQKLFNFNDIAFDKKALERGGFVSFIHQTINNSRLRLGPASLALDRYIIERVNSAIRNQKPIAFSVTTGSYKNINTQSTPHIDWAEVFQLSHLLKSLYRISMVYEPGIEIEYSGDSFAMCFIDNLKEEWVDTYNEELAVLFAWVSKQLPRNIRIKVKNIENWYDLGELEDEVNALIGQTDWSDGGVQKLLTDRARWARNNYCFNGRVDYSGLSPDKKEELIEQSVMRHKYYLDIDFKKRSDYLLSNDRIILVHRKGIPDCMPIVSVKGCDIQYWEGNGLLIERKNGMVEPRIFSPKQTQTHIFIDSLAVEGFGGCSPFLKTIQVYAE